MPPPGPPAATAAPPLGVTFAFDPSCPWTWSTSRWLVDVATRRPLRLCWRAFELNAGTPLEDVPAPKRDRVALSRRFLRVVEAAAAAGADDVAGELYAELGACIHEAGVPPGDAALHAAMAAVDVPGELRAAADDPALDAAMAASKAWAEELAGTDIGSPVLALHLPERTAGWFGPVVHPVPEGAVADELFDLVLRATAIPGFAELKTRRRNRPGS